MLAKHFHNLCDFNQVAVEYFGVELADFIFVFYKLNLPFQSTDIQIQIDFRHKPFIISIDTDYKIILKPNNLLSIDFDIYHLDIIV